jgi:nucleotide-binding universal stress UspA family protein
MSSLKNILVPTDFSACATDALTLAALIAKKTGASITLMNSYQPMAAFSEVGFYQNSYLLDDIEKTSIQQLETQATEKLAATGIPYTTVAKPGFAVENIKELCALHKIDLVVMGTRGASGVEELFGSNTATVIRNLTCPVIAVPAGSVVTDIRNIVLALDHSTPVPKLGAMLELARLFRAKIHVLSVGENRETVRTGGLHEGVKLEQQLKNVPHSYSFFEHNDIEEGIKNYARQHKADLIVMIPRKHGLFERLFKGSITRDMAYHTEIPLLTIAQ